jgi:hypothetical protein
MILAMTASHAIDRGREEHELLRLIDDENDLSSRRDRDRIHIDDLLCALSRVEAESILSPR